MPEINMIIESMKDQIIKLCEPCMIYLVSRKTNTGGELTSFKMCVVISDNEDISAVEAKLLLKTDCPVPCDFIVYNMTDWDDCAVDDCSFAYRVENGGDLLYVKK